MSAEKALEQKNTPSLQYAGRSIDCGSELDVADEMRRSEGDKIVLVRGSGLCFHPRLHPLPPIQRMRGIENLYG